MWSSDLINPEVGVGECEHPKNFELPEGYRVVQIHPTLQCNLKCRHCYSSSAPGLKGSLDFDKLVLFLKYAFDNGFNALSVSGGEPFLYKDLQRLLKKSKEIGYKNLVATNGMLLKSASAQNTLQYIDLAAVSIDGTKEIHDNIRAFDGAFDKMLEGVGVLNKYNINLGFIHTVTPETWNVLFELARFAREHGAKLFQIHPLENYGRAKEEFKGNFVTQETLHRTFIIGNFLQAKYSSEMTVQMDFLHKDYIYYNPATINYYGDAFEVNLDNFTKALQTIIIDENGAILPVSYGFSNYYQIGNIAEMNETNDLFKGFMMNKWKSLYKLFEKVYTDIIINKQIDFIPWSELIVKSSYK
ncbi:radical SAM protein [Rufibacter psychrotolerans]|uniref:radical SAM protein n=1 Tax=Rufibacter psychrotolerans TaxID=2812556 RepID=UPI001968A1F0|nr:radical SAM protein [Rufibacter sp. SYSU D00308]